MILTARPHPTVVMRNNEWSGLRYVRVRWWRLLDAVSSTRSISVLLSAVGNDSYNTNSPSASVVTVVGNHSHTCARAAFTSRSYYSRAAFISFKSFGLCDYYSRAASIRRNTVISNDDYVFT